jgi:hypothetical protein
MPALPGRGQRLPPSVEDVAETTVHVDMAREELERQQREDML